MAALALEQTRWLASIQGPAVMDHATHSMAHLALLHVAVDQKNSAQASLVE